MPDSTLLVFLITSLIVIASPGQDLILVVSRSIAMGSRAGVLTATGVSVGLLGHTLLAGIGLGAILQASEMLFTVMKYIGAAYLVYLGVKAFRAPPIDLAGAPVQAGTSRRLLLQGALSNLSNPKIAVFYFAYLPQFVSVDAGSTTQTLLALGAAFALLTFLVKAPVGYAAGRVSSWLRARPQVRIWMNRACGCVLIGLGVRLAMAQHTRA